MLSSVLPHFEQLTKVDKIRSLGDGLINKTWKIETGTGAYILQGINQKIFKNPELIAGNIDMLGHYLHEHFPDYLFVRALPTIDKKLLYKDPGHGYFRLFPFINGSLTIGTVDNTVQAREAAAQFGKFTGLLKLFDPEKLQITLPDFHNLSLRFQEMVTSVQRAPAARLALAREAVDYLLKQHAIVDTYENILNDPAFKMRVTHHDTKISNVLFDENDLALCVIDLDTVMPGYFISDLGDMMRTYLSPANEEEPDFSKISVRDDYFVAVVQGYMKEMGGVLSTKEKAHLVYAGKFMIYMQALRFLTDYLNNDIYYGQKYEGHNLIRAINQVTLLQRLIEKEELYQEMASSIQISVE